MQGQESGEGSQWGELRIGEWSGMGEEDLDVGRGEVAIEVEAALAHRDDVREGEEVAQSVEGLRCEVLRVVRVHTRRRVQHLPRGVNVR